MLSGKLIEAMKRYLGRQKQFQSGKWFFFFFLGSGSSFVLGIHLKFDINSMQIQVRCPIMAGNQIQQAAISIGILWLVEGLIPNRRLIFDSDKLIQRCVASWGQKLFGCQHEGDMPNYASFFILFFSFRFLSFPNNGNQFTFHFCPCLPLKVDLDLSMFS